MTTGAHRAARRHIVLHAHFYQPPREDPAFDEIDAEPSAAPFHDWNERIERECYRAVVAARVHGPDGRIAGIVNTLEWISFNVGPTLFEWLARHAPDTAERIVAADRHSVARLGHGNAIAHPYHHVILPLASRRDKVTEVRWGMRDFRRRFGRDPEGMWLPETAVDDETLDVLAQEGIRFTILAPHQVVGAPPNGHAGRYVTTNGRAIALFPYHGEISHGIAFGGLVRNADAWLDALWAVKGARRHTPSAASAITEEPPHPLLVSAATDGETYGHHHKFAELALARVLEQSRHKGGHVGNYAAFLAAHPARHDVTIAAPSSWSCSHGVERWRADCGCRMDSQAAPSQAWRTPLREGLVALGQALEAQFQREGAEWFADDPWAVRDAYGAIVGSTDLLERAAWLRSHLVAPLREPSQVPTRPLQLLEMSRDALRMFTSCAWFFDDIGGLEPRQALRYAARAIALSGEAGALEPPLRAVLARAASNDPKVGSGDRVYHAVTPPQPAPVRLAAAIGAMDHLGLLPADPMFGTRGDDDSLPAFDATVGNATVTVGDRRLATVEHFRVHVTPDGTTGVETTVIPLTVAGAPAGPAIAVSLADFPEAWRLRVRLALRDALRAQCLEPGELAQLASGRATLKELATAALVRAVRHLADLEDYHEGIRRVALALDLFEQLEAHIPFDAQTAFWDAWSGIKPSRRGDLQGIARRLGFAGDPG